MDEFDDVDPHEKLFMKVWNRHVRKYKIYADHNVSASFRNNRHRQCRIMLTRCDFFSWFTCLFNVSHYQVPAACLALVNTCREYITTQGLRSNVLLHLFNLWDNGLVNSGDISHTMGVLDRKPNNSGSNNSGKSNSDGNSSDGSSSDGSNDEDEDMDKWTKGGKGASDEYIDKMAQSYRYKVLRIIGLVGRNGKNEWGGAAKEKQLLKDYSKAQRKLVVAAADPLQMNQIDGSVQTMRERYPFIKMPSLWNGGERVEEEEDEDEEEDEEVVFERRKSSRTARIRSPQPQRSTKK